mgnify:FL=1
MNIGERIRILRKQLGLTQTEFAEKICITQSHLASNETGKRQVTDRTIQLVCNEFDVNEQWLRTGEGDMFQKVSPTRNLPAS